LRIHNNKRIARPVLIFFKRCCEKNCPKLLNSSQFLKKLSDLVV
jgi:hypothetical protein